MNDLIMNVDVAIYSKDELDTFIAQQLSIYDDLSANVITYDGPACGAANVDFKASHDTLLTLFKEHFSPFFKDDESVTDDDIYHQFEFYCGLTQ